MMQIVSRLSSILISSYPLTYPHSDYDQYYASLAASTNVSAQPTPTPTGTGGSHSSEFGDYNIDVEEEEDKKPNIEYLDSLNDYRKRSRSKEDDGAAAGKSPKVAKLGPDSNVNGTHNGVNGVNGHANGNGYGGSGGVGTPAEEPVVNGYEDTGMGDGYGYSAAEDDPTVYGVFTLFFSSLHTAAKWSFEVNGKPVPYSQVTEEDHELMTPDEYTAYFEIMQSRS